MCGISAVFDYSAQDESRNTMLHELLSKIEHRGRADTLYEWKSFKELGFSLGTHRLPIVEQSENRQPACGPKGSITLVMNAQIFNYLELKNELCNEGVGIECLPGGDAYILATAIEYWGIDSALKRLNWEGCFVAFDETTNSIYAARDHLGIKPLYYSNIEGKLTFSSEIKSLSHIDQLKQIDVVKPGTYLSWDLSHLGAPKEGVWWQLPTSTKGAYSIDSIEKILKEAVRIRVPDEPYAVLLSGGIDSSLVLKMALEVSENVTAYTLHDEESPDLPFARRLCSQLGVKLVEVKADDSSKLCGNLLDTITKVESWEWQVLNHAAPMDALFSAIRNDNYKVVLTGEGADELFCGYSSNLSSLDVDELQNERITRVKDLHKTNCRRVDRMAMSHSLECRVPFLDINVTNAALTLPVDSCIDLSTNKIPLREIASRILPEGFAKRPKLSFAKGVGYQYGATKKAKSVFGDISNLEITELPSNWAKLARYPIEECCISMFIELGYDKANYLLERSV
ncbi:asparagine synthase [Photobacterium gaetbulicola]|uniref:asparagine synthase (glutamine-hydrolyzing) n=1 Tax=Photobacterium gaetbulicola Gung47 TaxID=658445 RepID=A0A0C5W266_9GAMM|nr:asparagine synthase-related protein [Photobacterium gaetbulicola]AJR05491.1 hypothetical protein H744_1c0466 [Photobacterium gaetbulicola Gung47]PST99768.1 asparagine synthase [Photobacterium gaetbulicola]